MRENKGKKNSFTSDDPKAERKGLKTLFSRSIFDAYSFPQKYAVGVLLFVLSLTVALGLFIIKHCDFHGSPLPKRIPLPNVRSPFRSTQIDLNNPRAMVSGLDDTFFVAVGTTVHRYSIKYVNDTSIIVELLWKRNFKSTVTALHYVSGNTKAIRGMLLVALKNTIELVNPDQNEGSGTLFIELSEGSNITSLATGPNAVFAADSAKGEILRFDMLGNQNMTIGKEDAQTGFQGFEAGIIPFLSLAYLPEKDMIVVTNPQKSRVEIFHNSTGNWDSTLSWDKNPQSAEDGFYSGGNPIYIEVLPDESLLTVERGNLSRISNFLLDGKKRFEFDYPLLNTSNPLSPSSSKSVPPLISTGYTRQNQNALLLLSETGFFQIYVVSTTGEKK